MRAFRLLHVRGGVSGTESHLSSSFPSSPRPWRCFLVDPDAEDEDRVFSTSVEVFPQSRGTKCLEQSLLHVRGGVSFTDEQKEALAQSSPRPWRCFYLRAVSEARR